MGPVCSQYGDAVASTPFAAFTPQLPIRTERLELRLFRPEDFTDSYAYHSRPDVVRYLYQEPRTVDEYRAVLAGKIARRSFSAEGDRLSLAVVPDGVGHVVGDVMLMWTSLEHRQGEIGFVFHPDQHGRGYAGEASAALLDIGFNGLGLHRISGRLDARNTASARVLEKLGMRREAHLVQNEFVKGEWTDECIYAILRDEWSAAAG
jgi:RimJ/RimL family protein N-acetyltransferase